ncbi:hypothetical protein Purlil1_6219 [Purpureocillium lilacinum]|uniref:Uncharacterized protein n=1 Tax=Purpureocillium lilacinum TaxID=33203 RepID=A0ABR0BZ58_PURLI|nr:hypothetical protein Purlil1_6219 [Purpureocillium lilacinum]
MHDTFEAQLLTRQALAENRDRVVEVIGRLRERLESIILDGNTDARLQLLEDINTSKQCLEVCNMASSQVSQQKIHIIGEVIADGDSDQVVVTTLADLFDVKKATSKGRSAQLIGSTADDTLRQLSENRYSSRFGASAGDLGPNHSGTSVKSSGFEAVKVNPALPGKDKQSPCQGVTKDWPSPNQTRKRG